MYRVCKNVNHAKNGWPWPWVVSSRIRIRVPFVPRCVPRFVRTLISPKNRIYMFSLHSNDWAAAGITCFANEG